MYAYRDFLMFSKFDATFAAQTRWPIFMNVSSKNADFGKEVPFNYMFFSPMTLCHFFEKKQLPALYSQYALGNSNGRKMIQNACYTCCEIAISPLFFKQFSTGLHRWIWNWKEIISGVKNTLKFKGYILRGLKSLTLLWCSSAPQKKIKTQQDFLKLDDNLHIFKRKRQFQTFSVLKVW
jgi:hypothetical protein